MEKNSLANINLTDLSDLIAKIDFINGFLEENIPKIDKVIQKLETSSVFKENIDNLKTDLTTKIEELKKTSLMLEEELKNFNSSKENIKSINDTLKEVAENLRNIKITIKQDTLNEINNSVINIIEDIKKKEKQDLDNLLNDISNIVKANESNLEKTKNLILETGLLNKVKVFGFLGGLATGIIIGILLIKITI